MSKFTPGPWVKTGGGLLLGADGTDVVAAGVGLGLGADSGDGIRKANGKLIIAAPDLLEALQAFVNIYGIDDVRAWMKVRGQARAAIKKATT